jgi:hypothetical protein
MDNESLPFQAPSALRSLQVPAATVQVQLARVAASTSANHAVDKRKSVIEKGIHIESLHAIIIPLQLIPNRLKIESTTTLESDGTPQKESTAVVSPTSLLCNQFRIVPRCNPASLPWIVNKITIQ